MYHFKAKRADEPNWMVLGFSRFCAIGLSLVGSLNQIDPCDSLETPLGWCYPKPNGIKIEWCKATRSWIVGTAHAQTLNRE